MIRNGMRVAVMAAVMLAVAGTASAQSWRGESEAALRADAERQKADLSQRCSDFWVAYAFNRATVGGFASGRDCDVRNFNGGQWSSLSELITLMECYLNRGRFPCGPFDVAVITQQAGPNLRVITKINDQPTGYYDITPANIIAASAGIIAARAELVAAGGGNLVAAGGGNLVAAGGGNLVNKPGTQALPAGVTVSWPPNVSGGAGYRLLSVQEHRLGRFAPTRTRGKEDKDPLADIGKQVAEPPADAPQEKK